VTIDENKREVLGMPVIVSRGFVYMKDHTELTDEIALVARDATDKLLQKQKRGAIPFGNIKRELADALNDHIYKKTEREPMILPVVITV